MKVKKKIFLEFFKTMIFLIILLKMIFLTFDDSNYHSASEFSKNNIKIGCNDSCYNNTKTCLVLSKSEEQEDLLITLISKIENLELKEKYLKKLKKTMINNDNKPTKTKISLEETLERFA
jgi:hypothetical protein